MTRGKRSSISAATAGIVALAVAVVALSAFALLRPHPTVEAAGTTPGYTPPPPDTRPHVAFLGDSYINGHSGTTRERGFAPRASETLGWRYSLHGGGGNGYVKANPAFRFLPIPQYVDEVVATSPDLVVVEGGINEYDQDSAAVAAAALDTFTRLRQGLPEVPIVVIGPFASDARPNANGRRIRDAVKSAAAQVDNVAFIDPIEQGWLASNDLLRANDRIHLTDQGEQVYADRFVQAFQAVGIQVTRREG